MLNGKFYTGLPEKMMGQSKGPNRQKTNFFWPDESDMEQVVNTKTKIGMRVKKEMTPEQSDCKEIRPNSMHKKELSSRIAFYDKVEKERKPLVNSIEDLNKNVNVKRRDTFTSKIQFYDYEDDSKTQTNKINKNSNSEIDKNFLNSTKTCDKRISFTDNKHNDTSSATRSILKNNDLISTSTSTNSAKEHQTARLNLNKSRSMTDIAAHDNINVIENNVKNISISHNRNHNCYKRDERDNELYPPRRPYRNTRPTPRRNRPITEFYDDGADANDYTDYKHSTPLNHAITQRMIARNYEMEPDFNDSHDLPSSRNTPAAHNHCCRSSRKVSSREYDDDDYDYASIKSVSRPKLRSELYKPMIQNIFRDISPEHTEYLRREITPEFKKGSKLNNLGQTTNPTPPSVKNLRAHRHLVSSIGFGNDSLTTNSAKGIRNSAVTRVSVGLPHS